MVEGKRMPANKFLGSRPVADRKPTASTTKPPKPTLLARDT